MLKSTASSSRTITNHILSTVVFIIYLIEFIVVGIAATSVFFMLLAISLFDVVAGFTITIKTASARHRLRPHARQRDVKTGGNACKNPLTNSGKASGSGR